MTDKNKTPVWEGQKEPFGKTEVVTNTIDLNIRFPGQYYDPGIGRYLQSDPIGLEGGLNTYGYAYQNPVVNYDPDGQFAMALPLPWVLGGGVSVGTLKSLTGIGLLGLLMAMEGGGIVLKLNLFPILIESKGSMSVYVGLTGMEDAQITIRIMESSLRLGME